MNSKSMIKDIATLEGIKLNDKEVNDIFSKVAHTYLDGLLDNQNISSPAIAKDKETTNER